MPPMPPIAPGGMPGAPLGSGLSATIASVVINSPAIEAASCNATRTTLVGSIIPAATMSLYSPDCARVTLISALMLFDGIRSMFGHHDAAGITGNQVVMPGLGESVLNNHCGSETGAAGGGSTEEDAGVGHDPNLGRVAGES
jgi:hypothetical protein